MSKYGETHDIFSTHHVQTKAKLDLLLAKNTEIEINNDGVEALIGTGNASLASVDSKVVAVDTGACVVASSALPSGASTEASLSALSAKVTAVDTGACVVASSALPSGASTEASLSALSAKVTAVDTGACVVASSALPSGASTEATLSALSAKITAVDTGACVVASSALPSGASVSAKQDEIKTLITATNSALAGTITVSAPASTKSSSTPISAQSVAMATTFLSGEIDLSTARHISIFGSCDNVDDSHELDLMVSNESGGTFFPTSHSGYFLEGNYHALITNIPYRYVKLQLVNGNTTTATTFTIHISQSD